MATPAQKIALWGSIALGAGLLAFGISTQVRKENATPPVGAKNSSGVRAPDAKDAELVASRAAAAAGGKTLGPPSWLAPLNPQVHQVTEFLSSNCLDCHNNDDHLGDVRLEDFKDAVAIRKDRKMWARVLAMVDGGAMPPKEAAVKPDRAARDAFIANAKQVLAYVNPDRVDPGAVTMRRLNNAEYDNTVYDLLGMNFYPSKDFPPDDVSGGFDNNGDGLTISPLLMERYLSAEEAVVQQVLPEIGTMPLVSKIENLQPSANSYRQTSLGRDKIKHILPGGTLSTTGNIRAEGDYIFRPFAYWRRDKEQPLGKEVPTMEILIDGEKVASFQVDVLGYEGSIFYDTPPVHLKAGSHQFVVSWPLKEGQAPVTLQDVGAASNTGKDEPLGLYVRWAELNGPRSIANPLLEHAADAAPRDAAMQVIKRIATKAYRRPVKQDELETLIGFYDRSPGVDKLTSAYNDPAGPEALTWYLGVRPAVQAILVSPHFLFRVEEDPQPDAAGPHAITDYQLATRLSYFLWSSLPDEQLLALAAKNELHNNLEEQVRRMLKDARADAITANFAEQWLHLRMLKKVTPDREKFPEYTDALRDAMRIETLTFFNHVVTEDRSILDLIDGKFTYLNQALAELYGIVDTKGNVKDQANPVPGGQPIRGAAYVPVELQEVNMRAGVLTQASLLTLTSNPGRTSPVKRGKFIMEQFLGESPPPPPPNVPQLESTAKTEKAANLRQRMEQHRSNPSCASCHTVMDQIGFSFENFNAVGRFRTTDDDAPVDASGELPGGRKFNGPIGLQKILKDRSDDFTGALAQQMMAYALGRQMQYYDKPAVDKIVKATAADGYKFSRLVVEIVKSDPFRLRRGKDQIDE